MTHTRLELRAALLAALLAGLTAALPAAAQFRTLPDNTERGYLRHVRESLVSIDAKTMRLAPGATIRNQQNLIIVPTALPQQGAPAEYLVDKDGQIVRVWLLTPAEEARPRKPKPRR